MFVGCELRNESKIMYCTVCVLQAAHGCHGQLQETQRRQDVTATLAFL